MNLLAICLGLGVCAAAAGDVLDWALGVAVLAFFGAISRRLDGGCVAIGP